MDLTVKKISFEQMSSKATYQANSKKGPLTLLLHLLFTLLLSLLTFTLTFTFTLYFKISWY